MTGSQPGPGNLLDDSDPGAQSSALPRPDAHRAPSQPGLILLSLGVAGGGAAAGHAPSRAAAARKADATADADAAAKASTEET